MKRLGVGIVGTGERGIYVLGARIEELSADTGLYVHGLYDRNQERACEARDYLLGLRAGDAPSILLYDSLTMLLDDPDVDIVLLTSHTSAHREQAIRALESGKHVYLDKPIAATLEDAIAIAEAERRFDRPMIMGFTRRYEPAWRVAYEQLQSGVIGPVQMILLRSIIPYARYLQRWHRFSELSGGALNDKCSHHFDVFRWFAGSEPRTVQATAGRSQTFAPDPTAPARCSECDRDCPFRVLPGPSGREIGVAHRMDKDFQTVSRDRWSQPSWTAPATPADVIDACVYAPDSDIWDYAVSTVTFASGVVATLFWNIFGPAADDQETLELVGTSGRIVLERGSGSVRVVSRYGAHEETIQATGGLDSSHFGADLQLIADIARLPAHATPPAGVREGLEALRLVEATRRSAGEGGRIVRMKEIPPHD